MLPARENRCVHGRGQRLTVLALASLFAVNVPAFAQEELTDHEVRQLRDEVLKQSQFRYFDRLDENFQRASSSSTLQPPPTGDRSQTGKENDPARSRSGSSDTPAGGPQANSNRTKPGSGESTNKNGSTAEAPGDGIRRPSRQRPGDENRKRENADTEELDSLLGSAGSAAGELIGFVAQLFFWLVIVAVCALILGLVVMGLLNWRRQPRLQAVLSNGGTIEMADDRAPGDVAADIYLAEAMRLAGQGKFAEALARLVWGGMSSIERAGWIRYRRGLTMRDYLRSTRSHPREQTAFRSLLAGYEPVGFGRRPATSEGFEQALQSYRQGFVSSSTDVEVAQ
ncbi:MAG: DUF4129 domain-containing protein [Planctomycetaceae bacterium]|nr:DUF4129 domain-containing protein [Planctomycetaceae bacterium]